MTETWPSLLAALAVLTTGLGTGWLVTHLAKKLTHR